MMAILVLGGADYIGPILFMNSSEKHEEVI